MLIKYPRKTKINHSMSILSLKIQNIGILFTCFHKHNIRVRVIQCVWYTRQNKYLLKILITFTILFFFHIRRISALFHIYPLKTIEKWSIQSHRKKFQTIENETWKRMSISTIIKINQSLFSGLRCHDRGTRNIRENNDWLEIAKFH